MKNHTIKVLSLFLFISIMYSFSMVAPIDDGASLGDIKYSIIPPEVFIDNNSGWIEMKGDPISQYELYAFMYSNNLGYILKGEDNTKLPDVRGKFIRTVGNESAVVGEVQGASTELPDGMKLTIPPHTHKFEDTFHSEVPSWRKDKNIKYKTGVKGGSHSTDNDNSRWYTVETTKSNTNQVLGTKKFSSSSKETRPVNVAFYAYIYVGSKKE